mgnify:CR=1 FL=1
MIANIDPVKSAITSIFSAVIGSWYNYFGFCITSMSLSTANTAFQHAAWTVAITAGIVTIINGVRQWKHKPKKDESKN